MASGAWHRLEAPTTYAVRLTDIAAALAKLCRYCGQCRYFYSVAEHSCWVHDEGVASRRCRSQLVHLLLHDASEAFLHDIASPLKRLLGEPYRTLEQQTQEVILRSQGFLPPTEAEQTLIKTLDLKVFHAEWPHLFSISSADAYGFGYSQAQAALAGPLLSRQRPLGWTWRRAESEFLKRCAALQLDIDDSFTLGHRLRTVFGGILDTAARFW